MPILNVEQPSSFGNWRTPDGSQDPEAMRDRIRRAVNGGGGDHLFTSQWLYGVGNTDQHITDDFAWNDYNFCWSSRNDVLNVIAPGDVGWAGGGNVLRVTQLGDTGCGNIQLNPSPLTARQSHYLRMYFRNDETANGHWHPNTYNASGVIQHVWWSRYGNTQGVQIGMRPNWDEDGASLGYPRNGWFAGTAGVGLDRLSHQTWFRYEAFMEYTGTNPAAFPSAGAVFRFWPRIYNMAGTLLYDHNTFFHVDSNGSASQSLAAYYDGGGAFSVSDSDLARRFGIGNEGPGGSSNSGESWYIADVAVNLNGWIGA
jgi:hypothetical protein